MVFYLRSMWCFERVLRYHHKFDNTWWCCPVQTFLLHCKSKCEMKSFKVVNQNPGFFLWWKEETNQIDNGIHLCAQFTSRGHDHYIWTSNLNRSIFFHSVKKKIHLLFILPQNMQIKVIIKVNANKSEKNLQSLNHRQQECSCFTAASLCASHQIATGSDDRNCMSLDRCRIFVIALGDILHQKVIQTAILEWCAWLWRVVAYRVIYLNRNVFVFREVDARRNTGCEQLVLADFNWNVEFLVGVVIEFGIAAAASAFRFGFRALEAFVARCKVARTARTSPIAWSAASTWLFIITSVTSIVAERSSVVVGWCILWIALISLTFEARSLRTEYFGTALAADPVWCTTTSRSERWSTTTTIAIIGWRIFRITFISLTFKACRLWSEYLSAARITDPIVGALRSTTATFWRIFCITFGFTATETTITRTEHSFWATVANPVGFAWT